MRTFKTLATSLLGLSTAACLALSAAGAAGAAPASGTTAPSTTSGVSSHAVVESGGTEYWTAERMRSAIPGDVLAGKALQKRVGSRAGVSRASESGPPSTVQSQAPNPRAKAAQGKANASEKPVKHIGKVFFTLGGADYVCSGNSVSAANKSTVATAGHCVNGGAGVPATKFTFVPAYLDGNAPYGKWTAKSLHAPTQWTDAGDMTYDTGFAVMDTLDGEKLADVVGASGVKFNAGRGLDYKAFGYPAASPFDGESLKSCSGTAEDDPNNPQFNAQGIPCKMTGGSSGGPWFIGSSSTGYQNSINSYGYGSMLTTMYGPYWGSVIKQAYTAAAAS